MSNIAIAVHGLSKSFDGKEVIQSCNMTIEKGTIYGFLGSNGAGKTTVFKMLTGLLVPTMGTMTVLGLDVTKQNTALLSRIGSLIETPIFYDHLSATENLQIHLAYMSKDGDIEGTLRNVGLPNTGEQPVSTFSLGMRQRLAIARAMVHNPELLILDEPVNGLDPMGIRDIRKLFIDLVQNKGMTILISSHILSEIELLAEKIGVIANGTVLEEAMIEDIKEGNPNGLEDYFIKLVGGGNLK